MLTCLLVGLAALGAQDAARAADPAEKEPLMALVATGGHDYDEAPFREMFEQMAGVSVTFHVMKDDSEIFEDISDWSYDVLVLYNMSQNISDSRKANFLTLLEHGVGLVALHHAIAAYNDWPEFWKIIGARYFLKDTEVDGNTVPKSTYRHDMDIPFAPAEPAHPVTEGLGPFILRDETYKGFLMEPGNTPLLSADHPDAQREAAWARKHGNAKVCFIQPGHGPESFRDANYRRLVRQAILWTGGR